MIAMQYTIRLAGDFSADEVRDRVENRRGLFDRLSGLIHKSFLYNETEGLYAPFYVWEDDGSARAFLTGGLFQGLVETFGRPRVRCWTVIAYSESGAADAVQMAVKEVDAIAAETRLADLVRDEEVRHAAAAKAPGLGCHLVGIDPDRWELMRYSTWKGHDCRPACDADMMECYDILHLSRPVAPA